MGIEIHQEDRPEAEALATKVLACKRDIRQALGWDTGQRHQPQLHYGPQFDAETSDLDTVIRTSRGGCYAYLVGLDWWQHVRIARQVAMCDKIDWFVWCTIADNDLTVAQVKSQRRHPAGPNRIHRNCLTGRTLLAALRAYSKPSQQAF